MRQASAAAVPAAESSIAGAAKLIAEREAAAAAHGKTINFYKAISLGVALPATLLIFKFKFLGAPLAAAGDRALFAPAHHAATFRP